LRRNLALLLVGGALAGFVVVGMGARAPAPWPADDTARPLAAAASASGGPARTARSAPGSTAQAFAAAAPTSTLSRQDRPGALAAVAAPDRRGHGDGRAGRREILAASARSGAPDISDVKLVERAPAPRSAVAEGCKTCGDEVPF
jgi:hypothetical protein